MQLIIRCTDGQLFSPGLQVTEQNQGFRPSKKDQNGKEIVPL